MGSILVGVDGSEPCLRAVECAAREAVYRAGGLTLMTVYEVGLADSASRWPSDLLEREAVAAADVAGAYVREHWPGLDVDVRVVTGSPAEELLRHGREFDVIVVGSRGRGGFPGMRIGSVAYQVAAHAPGYVLVVGEEGSASEASGIVVGVDGSRHADCAVVAALRTASYHGDRVCAVWAWSPPVFSSSGLGPWARVDEEMSETQGAALDAVLARHLSDFPDVEVVRRVVRGQPTNALIDAAAGARMIAVGARGTRGFARLALGGVAHALLHHAPCPVLVAHRV
ncbi:universal stress protein [Nocardiopsis lucentensis]|uniref:universal stress protein n=1 Tax=Nocardiopsis lucentensis TaxID=53441 RepID=UPI00034C7226|nr:universal stress protein [Nocardiopsis lucentensis]